MLYLCKMDIYVNGKLVHFEDKGPKPLYFYLEEGGQTYTVSDTPLTKIMQNIKKLEFIGTDYNKVKQLIKQ